jgi:hypothetical protein
MDDDLPARPLIGLLLRLVYQQYALDIETALREAGFGDIRPGAANVFPFVPPDGISVSRPAELARVRKQSMAQAATSSAALTRPTSARGLSSSPSAARQSRRSPTRPPSGWSGGGRS